MLHENPSPGTIVALQMVGLNGTKRRVRSNGWGKTNTLGGMRMSNRKGFTLIELLIVVVIIGILAAIAIPKFAATKDKAKLASVKTDLRNSMTAQEAYFSDFTKYGSFADLQTKSNFTLSAGNTNAGSAGGTAGYAMTFSNPTISTGIKTCTVAVGASAATSTVDGVIICS
jgi:prepilin-type N-terminal cleavage/methylation domain-containing protein